MSSAVLFGGAAAFVTVVFGFGYRVVRGPTVHDRLIALNAVGTTTIVIVALVGAALDEPGFLDIALVYALLNFLLSVGMSKLLVERGRVL